MRKRLAELLAALTALTVVVLAALFSRVQNLPGPAHPVSSVTQVPAPSATGAPGQLAAGRSAYERNGCGGCHSIGGDGNPRSPLDGVGDRLPCDQIADWIVASERIKPRLSAGTVRIKQSFAALPEDELHAMADYLASLRAPGSARER